MKKLMRSLLGVILLAGLLPVAAVALPRGLEDLMFWIGDKGTAEVHAGPAVMAVADPKRPTPPFGTRRVGSDVMTDRDPLSEQNVLGS